MAEKIVLEDLAEKFDEVNDMWHLYLNIKTREFVEIPNDYLSIAEDADPEDLDEYQDWDQDELRLAISVLENWEDYIELPSQHDIHEYSIMEEFASDMQNPRKSNQLLGALQGKGAFRKFKDTVSNLGLDEAWYAYRFAAFMQIAKEWCESHDILYRTR